MLGITLLVLSIILYLIDRYRYLSFFLFVGFLTDGYNILINPVLGNVKNIDLALIYIAIISVFQIITKRYKVYIDNLSVWYHIFVLFLIASFAFSYFYYKMPFREIIQGGRYFLLILSYPLLRGLSYIEAKKLMEVWKYFSVAVAVVCVLQSLFQTPIMPLYSVMRDPATGLLRFFNFPFFITPFLLLAINNDRFYGKHTNIVVLLFMLSILGCLGRVFIFLNFVAVLYLIYLKDQSQKAVKYLLIISAISLPFASILIQRYGMDTVSDMTNVFVGGISVKEHEMGDGNMTYRFSWVLERFLYLINRPLEEQFFGLGMVSDGSPLSVKMYNFVVRIKFTDATQQLRSPDIAYGTMIAYLGFGGSLIYIIFVAKLAKFFRKIQKFSPYYRTSYICIIFVFLNSFAGDSLSTASTLSIYFVILAMYDGIKNWHHRLKLKNEIL